MNVLISFLYVLEGVVCLLLGGIVLLQKPKDGGMNAMMGGGMGEALFGAQVGNVLVKGTIILGTVFLLNTLLLSKLTSHGGSGSVMEGVTTPPPQSAPSLPLPQPTGMPSE
ncbi:MAG: preprotein translocase subunit SecG [Kiritimatiellaeota bacterium]|nr:preprotein translocase subunit SecG [Kiritimatiellota bacterium]